MRRRLLILSLLLTAACGAPRVESAPRPATDADYLRSRDLMVPVHGVKPSELRDTYNAPRSGGRAHLALDILAKKGTRVLSVDDGVILRITENDLGGKVIYIADPSRRFVYYYAHLDEWKYGLKVGDTVKRGQLIGSVGTTGNAPKDTPHLHFQLMRMGSGGRYWSGTPINPIPYLKRTGDER